jgi:hypothetical protein
MLSQRDGDDRDGCALARLLGSGHDLGSGLIAAGLALYAAPIAVPGGALSFALSNVSASPIFHDWSMIERPALFGEPTQRIARSWREAFAIAVDFTEVSCAGCAEDLGEWRAFRERLRRGIRSARWLKESDRYDPKGSRTEPRRGLRSSRS